MSEKKIITGHKILLQMSGAISVLSNEQSILFLTSLVA